MTAIGPLFDGRAAVAAELAVKATSRVVAEAAEKMVQANFAGSIRNSTGVFDSQFVVIDSSQVMSYKGYSMPVAVGPGEAAVTTENAAYGPWLEGVGSRNDTTRFKGYWGFRRASDELDGKAAAITEAVIAPFVAEMNMLCHFLRLQ